MNKQRKTKREEGKEEMGQKEKEKEEKRGEEGRGKREGKGEKTRGDTRKKQVFGSEREVLENTCFILDSQNYGSSAKNKEK